jgi:hypothetical protein
MHVTIIGQPETSFVLVRCEHMQSFARAMWSWYSYAQSRWITCEFALMQQLELRYQNFLSAGASIFACFNTSGKSSSNGRFCKFERGDDESYELDFETFAMRSLQKKGWCNEITFAKREICTKIVLSPNLTPAAANEVVVWKYTRQTSEEQPPERLRFNSELASLIELDFLKYIKYGRKSEHRTCVLQLEGTALTITFDDMRMRVKNIKRVDDYYDTGKSKKEPENKKKN